MKVAGIVPMFIVVLAVRLHCTSIVYSFRVAEVIRLTPSQIAPSNERFLGFTYYGKKFDSTREISTGLMATYRYNKKNLYIQVDSAVGHVESLFQGCKFQRTQTDDILLSIGYSKQLTKKIKGTVTSIFGFPTHADLSPEGIQFGIAHNSFGLQMDGVFLCSNKGNQSILAAARYFRIFPGNITMTTDTTKNIIVLDIGNLVDVLVGYSYTFGLNGLEFGYNPEFLFSGSTCPHIAAIENKLHYIESYFYGAYYRIFLRKVHTQFVSLVFTYGIEHRPKIYKQIIYAWATWSVNF